MSRLCYLLDTSGLRQVDSLTSNEKSVVLALIKKGEIKTTGRALREYREAYGDGKFFDGIEKIRDTLRDQTADLIEESRDNGGDIADNDAHCAAVAHERSLVVVCEGKRSKEYNIIGAQNTTIGLILASMDE